MPKDRPAHGRRKDPDVRPGATRLGRMVALVVGLWVMTAAVVSPQSNVIEAVLVKVNGAIITKTELEERQIQHLRRLNQQGQLNAESDADVERALAEATPQIIADAINELLVVQRGRDMGISMNDAQFTEMVDNIKDQNNLESDEQFQEALDGEGMTLDEFRRAMERQMIISQVQQYEVMNKVVMTDFEVREYYDTHPEEYRTPARVTLREILIAAPEGDRTPQIDQALLARAEAARQRILSGETFALVAADVSDAPSKANGGLIGPLNEEELAPAVRELFREMEVGDISQLLNTSIGYQLLQYEFFTEATRQPFEEVRQDISNRVFNERRSVEFASYMANLRQQANHRVEERGAAASLRSVHRVDRVRSARSMSGVTT